MLNVLSKYVKLLILNDTFDIIDRCLFIILIYVRTKYNIIRKLKGKRELLTRDERKNIRREKIKIMQFSLP